MAIRSSILAWKIPWTEEPAGLQSRESDTTEQLSTSLDIHSIEPKGYLKYTSEVESLSPVRLFATPWTVAHQAPLSIEFSRQEYWSGLPFLSPEAPLYQDLNIPSNIRESHFSLSIFY